MKPVDGENAVWLHTKLTEWGFAFPADKPGKLYRRFSGDLLALGKGEILVALS